MFENMGIIFFFLRCFQLQPRFEQLLTINLVCWEKQTYLDELS